jgi:hypothetical protein
LGDGRGLIDFAKKGAFADQKDESVATFTVSFRKVWRKLDFDSDIASSI